MKLDDKNLKDVILILYDLMKDSYSKNKNGWVNRKWFIKNLVGSYSAWNDAYISAILDILNEEGYVIISGNVLRLTQALVESCGKQEVQKILDWNDPHSISRLVRNYASTIGNSIFGVKKVEWINYIEKHYLYWILIDYGDEDVHLGPGTPARLGNVWGNIAGSDDGNEPAFYFITQEKIYISESQMSLLVDRGYLISQLGEQIDKLEKIPRRFVSLVNEPNKRGRSATLLRNSNQLSAGLMAEFEGNTSLLWGPPGAGKTYGLASVITKFIKSNPNDRVLLLAPSNLAADVLMLEIINAFSRSGMSRLVDTRHLLRYGYAQKHEILIHEEIMGSYEQQEITSRIKCISMEIERTRKSLTSMQLAEKRAELMALREDLKHMVEDHIISCNVVVTSTTLGYLTKSPILNLTWDMVVIDEVTMVPAAILYYLSRSSQKSMLLAGDPRQLGPVFQENRNLGDNEKSLFGKDVFEIAGIMDISSENMLLKDSGLLYRIMEQRRCHPDIWKIVGGWYPGVKINYRKNKNLIQSNLFDKRVYHINISNITGIESEKRGKSWINKVSADLSIKIIANILRTNPKLTAGIICPYSAQEYLIKRLIDGRDKNGSLNFEKDLVEVGTVHRFQGSSADVILVDFVGSQGKRALGPLLTGKNGVRLLTVAFSRAKELLITIADDKWHISKLDDCENPLLQRLFDSSHRVPISEAIKTELTGLDSIDISCESWK